MFGDTEIEKHKFHYHKFLILIYVVDINKIIVSNKFSFSKNAFKFLLVTKIIKFRPCIMLPKIGRAWRRELDETKFVSFDKISSTNYNKIWNKLSNRI